MSKIQIHCTIPKDFDTEFRDLVARLEGPWKKGSYGKHLAMAIKEYVTSHNKQQQIAKNEQNADPKRKEIMKTREVMEKIRKEIFWKGIEINRGTGIPEKLLLDAIIKVKNLKNNPGDRRTPYKWIRKLIEYEFIHKKGFNMYEVLDTGQDWSELETIEEKVEQENSKLLI